MANNVSVIDGGSTSKTFKTTDIDGVHTPHVNVDNAPQGIADGHSLAPVSAVQTGSALDYLSRTAEAVESTAPVRVELAAEYETVAASQTNQVLGATGAVGDRLEHLICVVSAAATSQVQIKDGTNTAIIVLPNSVGAGIGTYPVPLGLVSVQGAWQVTTAAGVSVIGVGDFT